MDINEDRGPELLALLWLFAALAALIVLLKIYTRCTLIKQTGLDDVLIGFSLLLVFISNSIYTAAVHSGMGRHTAALSTEQAKQATRLNLIANPFGIMALSFPNVSVAIFLNRILYPIPWLKLTLYTITIGQCVVGGISSIILLTQCRPTESLWDPAVRPRRCLPADALTKYAYFVGAYTAFTDVLLAVVPAAAFWRLQMKTAKKVGLTLLMATTLGAAVVAVVKTTKLDELEQLEDFTYASVDLVITTGVEANVIIIAACIPSLRPFVHEMSERIQRNNSRGTDGSKTNSLEPMRPEPVHLGLGMVTSETVCTSDDANSVYSRPGIEATTEMRTEWQKI